MRFTLFFLGTLGLVLVAAAAVNYIVNPYAVYPPRWFMPASTNDLERALREIENPSASPELVVLGSSRSWVLLSQDLECYSGLESMNSAYASATPEGYFALTSFLLRNKPAPKLLIVGVDVEAFESEGKFGDKVRDVPRLQRYLHGWDRLGGVWTDTTSLFSLAQLNDSARVLSEQAALAFTPPPVPAGNETKAEQKIQEQTGTGTGGQPTAQSTEPLTAKPIPVPIQNAAEATAKRVTATYLRRFNNYKTLSVEEQGYFEALLRLAQEYHIRVKLFVSTMHPQLIAALNKQGYYPKRKAEVYGWLQELESKYSFELYDFSTPDTFGGNTTDFYNLAHIDAANSARLIGALFQETGRAAQCARDH